MWGRTGRCGRDTEHMHDEHHELLAGALTSRHATPLPVAEERRGCVSREGRTPSGLPSGVSSSSEGTTCSGACTLSAAAWAAQRTAQQGAVFKRATGLAGRVRGPCAAAPGAAVLS